MEHTHEELSRLVNQLTFQTGEVISHPEIPGILNIDFCKSEDYPATWHYFTRVGPYEDGVAFYLDPRIPEEFRRPIIFHEIFEAERVWTLSKDYLQRKLEGSVIQNYHIAHMAALEPEMRYARETLSSKDFQKYVEFTNEIRKKRIAA